MTRAPVPAPLYLLELEVPRAAGPAFADLLSALAAAFSCFEAEAGSAWRFAAYFKEMPVEGALEAASAVAALAAGIAPPALGWRELPERDWLEESRRALPPLSVGRFFIRGSHVARATPPGRIALLIEAGLAFGSGRHESTRGCLLALARLERCRRRRHPRRCLDLGCGSGVLALAMAKLWRARIEAADVDPAALAVARENARRNLVASRVDAFVCDERGRPALGKGRRYDLIAANILARPLRRLAPALARALRPGGFLILGGIMGAEWRSVAAAYRGEGLALVGRTVLGEWVTLVLRRKAAG